ncbi:MAG TPA: MFS transporter [Candidatus Sulfopaludibacter sp.]|jgi:MFS family permease|nr:MFS transporter [Candidatus Sulfopaludibacter sp.]
MSSQRYAWLVVALLWVVACLNYLDRQVIFSVFPLLRAEMRLDDFQLGLLSTVFLWVYGLASPFGGYLADRAGRRKVLILSLAIWTTITLLTGYVRNFQELLIARGLMGLSEACYLPAALALISDLHGKSTRSRATGIHQSGLYAGIAFGGAIGGWMGERHGWRSPFIVLGIVGVVYSIVLAKGLRGDSDGARAPATPVMAAFGEVVRLPGFAGMLAAFTGFGVANWVVYTWLPLYIFERFRVSLTSAGFSATFYLQVASFAGILAGGWEADRWSRTTVKGRVLTQALGLAAASPFLFLVGAAGSIPILVAALIAFGIGKGFFDANTMPVLAQVARPELRATGYGIFNLAACVVGGAMAAAAGALKPAIGLSGAIQVSAVMLFASAMALLLVGRVLARAAATAMPTE